MDAGRKGGREGSAHLDGDRQIHKAKKKAHLPWMLLHGQKQGTSSTRIVSAAAAATAVVAATVVVSRGGREEEAVSEGVGGDAATEEEGEAAACGFGEAGGYEGDGEAWERGGGRGLWEIGRMIRKVGTRGQLT